MEQFLDASLQDWKLDLEAGSREEREEWGMDIVHFHRKTNSIWRTMKRLGSGAFGEVWQQRCTWGESACELRAVKRISKTQTGFLKSSQRELKALARFSVQKKEDNRSKIHDQYEQRFVQFLGWYEDTDYLYFAMEFMECGDLQQFINKRAPFEEDEAATIIQQVAEALQFMHTNDFIHRDLKPSNILVAKAWPAWHVKVADFGIAKDFGGASLCTIYVGTHGYIAPEMIDSANYTAAVDVWSLGAVAFCLRTAHPPFATSEDLVQYRAGQKDFPSRVLGISTGFCIDFILAAMRPLPETRLNIRQILDHEWLHMRETRRTLTTLPLLKNPLPTMSIVNKPITIITGSVSKTNAPINTTRTCLTCNQSFLRRRDLFHHLAKHPDHGRDLLPSEQQPGFMYPDKTLKRDHRGMFKRRCEECWAEFETRAALFEHLEARGHALTPEQLTASGWSTVRHEYKRPEVCRKRDREQQPAAVAATAAATAAAAAATGTATATAVADNGLLGVDETGLGDERMVRHDATGVDQNQRIKEERERQGLAAESINKKAPEGQKKQQRELSFFWKKKEEEELKRQEELRRRQEIVKREEEAEVLERGIPALNRQAELERERKKKEELEQARAQQAQQALWQQELLQQHQQQQQQEREKRAREEPEDATEQEQEPDAERIKRVKKELKTTCMVCGEKFQHRGQLSRHMNKWRHWMPKEYWGSGGGVSKITDLDALEVLRRA